jgi:serine/threonine protein kinase
MSVTADQLWNLTVVSGLVAAEHRPAWREQFAAAVPAEEQADVGVLAKWLIQENIISRYQAGVLLSGKSGPFRYGDFQIYDRLAEGGWKGCYRAVHRGTQHPVVVKFVPTNQLKIDSWGQIQGVVASRQAWDHPVFLKCHLAASEGKYRMLIFDDFPAGQALVDHLAESTLPAKEAARIVRVISLSLGSIHDTGQAHGDIRPENVWVGADNSIFLICDPTHVAGPLTPEIALTQANYRAPEFPLPGHASAPLADTYALGCLMYHAVAGQPPFADGDVAYKQQCHAMQPVAALAAEVLPSGLFQLLTYMMAKNPGVRYQQISDVAEQTVPFLDNAALKINSRDVPGTYAGFAAAIADKLAQPALGIGMGVITPPTANPPILPPTQPAFQNGGAPLASQPTGQIASGQIASGQIAPPSANQPQPSVPAQPVPNQPALSNPASISGQAKLPAALGAGQSSQGTRIREQKKRQFRFALLSFLTLVVVGVGGYYGFSRFRSPFAGRDGEMDPDGDGKIGGGGESNGGDGARPQPKSESDNGTALWASPTSGPPLELSMVPFESMGILAIRPKEILADKEGQRLFRSLGPAFESWRTAWERRVGFKLEDVEHLIISLHPQGDDLPDAAYVVTLAEEITRVKLLEQFGNPDEKETDGDAFYDGVEFAAFLPDGESIKRFAIGSAARMKDVGELEGGAPPPRPGLEPILRASDLNRHINVLFVPYFVSTNLLRDGREYYFGEAKKAREPLDWLLGSGIKAGSFSVHLGRVNYFELQLNNDVTKNPYKVANDLRNRVNEVPLMIETYIAQQLNPPVYWRQLAIRYPSMIRFLHDEARIQVDGKLAVVNAILPKVAAHNLAAGGELLLASRPSEMMIVGTPKTTIPQSMDELLMAKTKIAFAQQSFENVIKTIETDIVEKFPNLPFYFDLKVIGRDLEGNGITRNKEVRNFDSEGSIADVLTALCLKVNPVTTVTKPSEVDQKLVWVVGPDPDDESKTVILITTRDASAAKNYTLPVPFRLE